MSRSDYLSTFCLILLLLSAPAAQASLALEYQQSQDFWGVLDKIQHGVKEISSANALLNQTYGKPVGAEVSIVYRKDEINPENVTLREVRLDQVGYAVSSNPILPHLFGFEGQGLTATVGYQFVEIYGSHLLGKRVDAVSTDLIDRRLVDNEDITFFGAGIHYRYVADEAVSFPLSAELFTRSTRYISSALPSEFITRWKLEIEAAPMPEVYQALYIFGQNPIPGYNQQAVIWNYLWKTDTFPDFFSAVGIGVRTPVYDFLKTQATAGFFGGYVGARVDITPLDALTLSLHSFGLETSSAYRASELRLWGADLSYVF